jgi:hypothetical protein
MSTLKWVIVATGCVAMVTVQPLLAQGKILWADKKAKIPVTRIVLRYVHCPIDLAIESQTRSIVLQKLEALGYQVDDRAEVSEFRSDYTFHGNLTPPRTPGQMLSQELLEVIGKEARQMESGIAVLALGVFRLDEMEGETFTDVDKHSYRLDLTTAAELTVFPAGKKPALIWGDANTYSWHSEAESVSNVRIPLSGALDAISKSVETIFKAFPPRQTIRQ